MTAFSFKENPSVSTTTTTTTTKELSQEIHRKDLEKQFKTKISEKRLRFEYILASFSSKKKKWSVLEHDDTISLKCSLF